MHIQSKPAADFNSIMNLITEGSMMYQVEDTPLYVEFMTINSDQLVLSLPDKNQIAESCAQNSQLDLKVISEQAEKIAKVLTQEIESDKEIIATTCRGIESIISNELPSLARRLLAVNHESNQISAETPGLTELQELEDWWHKTVRIQILNKLKSSPEAPANTKEENVPQPEDSTVK